MPSHRNLQNHTVAVTGASSGIGAAFARALAGRGPPGMGHFLLKIGKKPGVPLRTVLTEVERDVNDTNRSWAQAAARFHETRARALRDASAGEDAASEMSAA
ncbi:MAG: hypothetical protein ACTHUU_12925 [Brachybacterium sp.]